MCGIAGQAAREPRSIREHYGTFCRMQASLARRGPDQRGIYLCGQIGLVHTRLAVVDLQNGQQPMLLDWKDEQYALVYNGELYNTQELRAALSARGHCFEGHSDTEVLLHAYAEWGQRCVERFNGIFAFAVWEAGSRTLFLARDRCGVKPLFFAQTGDSLIFASEIKALLCHPEVPPQVDSTGLAEVMLLGPGRTPGCGVFRGVRELLPGQCAVYEADSGRLTLRTYWTLQDHEHIDSFPATAARVRDLVADAAERQLVSDVPVASFLSGGLDSSILSALADVHFASQGRKLKTFSVGYRDNKQYFHAGKFQPTPDAPYIRIMNEALHAEHHWVTLDPADLVPALYEAVDARDLPGMADVDASLLLFCKAVKPYATVVLSGECADEIFGGYPWYRDPEVRDRVGFPWAQNTIDRCNLLHPDLRAKLDGEAYVMEAYLKTCRESDILPGCSPRERRMKEMVNLNFRWFMQTLLDRKDRMSMFSGLEVRVPFCDYRIAEYLYGVPWEYKDYQGEEKGLLRYACGDLLPEAVAHRKKSPYPKTFDPRYETLLEEKMQAVLSADSPLFALVDREALKMVLDSQSPWPWYGQLMARPQKIAYFLQIDFWLRHYGIELQF